MITQYKQKQKVQVQKQEQKMHAAVQQQMQRYPIFSYQSSANPNPQTYITIDESQQFKDQQLATKMKNDIQSSCAFMSKNVFINKLNNKKNQTIISIYDQISANNSHDPLYSHVQISTKKQKQKQKQRKYATVANTARNSRCELQRNAPKNSKTKAINRFVGEIATSIQKQQQSTNGTHHTQKISLLKRIIQHYNIKSIERKYYSNLIKNFGLKIQSVNSNDIAVKKNIHPRQSITKNSSFKEMTEPIQQFTQCQSQSQEFGENQRKNRSDKKFSIIKRNKPITSLNNEKNMSFHNYSRENLKTQKSKITGQERASLRGQISQKMRRSVEHTDKLLQKPLKLQISTCIQDKIKKYKQFLFIVNFSNRLYRDLDVQKYDRTFKFYVGKGNNGNLIKSLMKKRFWFEQTNNYMDADFIWTQIKIDEIFLQQQSNNSSDINTSHISIHSPQKTSFTKEQNSNIDRIIHDEEKEQQQQQQQQQYQSLKFVKLKQEIKLSQKHRNSKYIKFGKYKNKARDYAPSDPLLKVLSFQDAKYYKQATNQNYNIYKKNQTFHGKYKQFSQLSLNIDPICHKIHNHVRNNGLLGNKKALFYSIKQYCKLTNTELSSYIPPTYHIRKGLIDQQYKALACSFIDNKKNKRPNYWIIKPGQFSNRGQGITCTSKLQDIRLRLTKCAQQSKSNINNNSNNNNNRQQKQSTLIVQKYINNPLLYNGRKFDIRAFMMITVNNGNIKGYWYQQGYVRTSSFIWGLGQMQDKFVHLTNDAVQKNCQEYGMYQPGNKLTYADLQKYIHTLPNNKNNNDKNMDFFDTIYPQMRRIATDAIRCTCLNLDPNKLCNNFEIFGLDFMIDQNLKTWLIQVNTNPCLQLSCPILQRILPHLIQNSFRISIDPLYPPPSSLNCQYKYSIPENALFYNKFELVYDEKRDGSLLKTLYKNSKLWQNLAKDDIEEDQEVYEGDGEIIQINDQRG